MDFAYIVKDSVPCFVCHMTEKIFFLYLTGFQNFQGTVCGSFGMLFQYHCPDSGQRALMLSAMQEVIRLANAEGVPLPPDDDVRWLAGAIPRFRPDSKPSMGQDVDARRPTEVEEFSGVVRRLSARHGLPTPANDFFYRAIRAIEAGWTRN